MTEALTKCCFVALKVPTLVTGALIEERGLPPRLAGKEERGLPHGVMRRVGGVPGWQRDDLQAGQTHGRPRLLIMITLIKPLDAVEHRVQYRRRLRREREHRVGLGNFASHLF